MVSLTKKLLLSELERRSDADGSLSHDMVARLAADGPWEGRLWSVLQIFGADWEKMAYLAGGVKPEEVATWVGIWSDSDLTTAQIRLVISAGGYDPDPFVTLARHDWLEKVLTDATGSVRRIDGELAGAWMSDQFAEATDEEILAWAEKAVPLDIAPLDTGSPT